MSLFRPLFLSVLLAFICQASKGQGYIKDESLASLNLELKHKNVITMGATGFIIKPKSTYYLVTNWHVVTNKNPSGGWVKKNQKIEPDRIIIQFRGTDDISSVYRDSIYLRNENGEKVYGEFSYGGEIVDVVAIPLKNLDEEKIKIYEVNYDEYIDDFNLEPAHDVSVIGFPKGREGNFLLPIWKTGFVASEPSLPQQGLPLFFIDIDCHAGMSGAPVYFFPFSKSSKDAKDVAILVGIFSNCNDNINLGTAWNNQDLRKFFDTLP